MFYFRRAVGVTNLEVQMPFIHHQLMGQWHLVFRELRRRSDFHRVLEGLFLWVSQSQAVAGPSR